MLIPMNFEPGFYTEQTPSGAVNRWKDGQHVRFRYRLPEKMMGNERIPGSFLGQARALHDWVSLDNEKWTAIGTSKKLYIFNDGTYYDITPIRSGSLPPFTETPLVDPFTTTNTSDIVEVYQQGHGLGEGDFVHYSNASPVGGITIDGEYEVVSVIDFEKFTIRHWEEATSSATGGGVVDWMYEISTQNPQFFGWGGGVFGGGVWGGAQPSGLPDRLRMWSLLSWGEDLIANPRDGAIYWWDRTLGPGNRAVIIDAAPRRVARILLSAQDRHLLALGADDPLNIAWCSQEDFDTWVATPLNTAGDQRVDIGSELITGIRARGEQVIFSDEAVMAIAFEGPPIVFGFVERGESLSIISPNAVAEINGLVFFMATSDFMVYDGLLRVMPCDIRDHVFGRINTAMQEKVYASINRKFNEVWWYFPTGDSVEPNEYAVYNYLENCWYYGTRDRTAMHDKSAMFGEPYAAHPDGYLTIEEVGTDEVTFTQEEPYLSNFETFVTPNDSQWRPVVWAQSLGIFCAMGAITATTQKCMTSVDGINWTVHSVPDINYRDLCWADSIGVFVAVSSTGAQRAYTSTDGQTFTPQTTPLSLQYFGVAWSPELGMFAACATTGTTQQIMTSTNGGVTWVARTTPVTLQWRSLAWSPTLGMFAAVAGNGSGNQIMTSTNGTTWVSRTTPAAHSNDWRSIIWAPDLEMFVAVAIAGTINRVMTSTDGVNWSTHPVPVANSWRDLAYSPLAGLIMAVAFDGGNDRAMVSSDGVNWEIFGTTELGEWRGIAWSPALQMFASVTNDTASNNNVMLARWVIPEPEPEMVAIPSRLESYDGQIGEGDYFMHISRCIPDFQRLIGSIDMRLSSKAYPADPSYTVKGPYTLTNATRMVDVRIRGRQISVSFETSAVGDDWRFGTFRVDAGKHGRRA